ncbi:tetratricopeptide repeat protein [Sphingomonas xanthus]|uniref:Tetratricopeptide repeat protein n=1 Tax=Sphingomonas xanthus TaxID=2594473 RepID=A0A516IPF7_9SPHN|nr:tetratricopeptide repeat protein [Sphingomonas xanthus]QDP18654.1 tetratricopeptide repeat protein [Sphingomonas xanthus]
MGLLIIALLAAFCLGLLWLARLRGPVLTLSAAALAFGCAGYALQGSPGLAGSPRASTARQSPMSLATARHTLTGQFDYADIWLNMADALASRGNTADAVNLLSKQVERHPNDYKLWLGLGNALADHARTLSPAARLAFERSAELAPGYPGPLFFLGLAEARSGNPAEAERLWREALAGAPADASWRPLIEDGLLMISGGPAQRPPVSNQAGS